MDVDTKLKVYEELAAINKKNDGLLRACDVVKFAKSKRTALHGRFEWDDSIAGKEYRLHQARKIIRVFVEVVPDTKITEHVYVSLTPDRVRPGGGYRTIVSVITDEEKREQLLSQALGEMRVFIAKYKRLQELSGVFDAMQEVENQIDRTVKKPRKAPKKKRK